MKHVIYYEIIGLAKEKRKIFWNFMFSTQETLYSQESVSYLLFVLVSVYLKWGCHSIH